VYLMVNSRIQSLGISVTAFAFNTKYIYLRHYCATPLLYAYVSVRYLLEKLCSVEYTDICIYGVCLYTIDGNTGLLQLINWNYFYAFLTIAFIGFLGKAVTSLILYIEEKYQTAQQILQASPLLQPAMKPFDKQNGNQSDEED
jgi:hypothetical protein